MSELRIGQIRVQGDAVLAPLAGVTDVGFRSIAKSFGAALTYTEMVSVKGLVYGSEKTEDLLKTADCETIKAVQLFGGEPEFFSRALQLEILDRFDLIDINMGCPVPKITSNGAGSALMLQPERAEKIVKACVKQAKGRPVTVKIRSGYDEEHRNAVEFAKRCEGAGASLVTVHGRTKTQGYSGRADYAVIEKVAAALQIPVIGNGDVFEKCDYDRMKQTGVSGVMIARGALGRPWIFAEIAEFDVRVCLKEIILEHMRLMKEYYSERFACLNMRKHIAWYVKGRRNATELKRAVFNLQSTEEIKKAISNFDFDA